MTAQIHIILGSETDISNANKILRLWRRFGLDYVVSIASCHWHSGAGFDRLVSTIQEKVIAFLGGMSLQAPAIIESMEKNQGEFKLVIGIPTDEAALSAIMDLPKGTGILTTGLNRISLSHSLENAALTIAKNLALIYGDLEIQKKILDYHREKRDGEKRIQAYLELDENGLIPDIGY